MSETCHASVPNSSALGPPSCLFQETSLCHPVVRPRRLFCTYPHALINLIILRRRIWRSSRLVPPIHTADPHKALPSIVTKLSQLATNVTDFALKPELSSPVPIPHEGPHIFLRPAFLCACSSCPSSMSVFLLRLPLVTSIKEPAGSPVPDFSSSMRCTLIFPRSRARFFHLYPCEIFPGDYGLQCDVPRRFAILLLRLILGPRAHIPS